MPTYGFTDCTIAVRVTGLTDGQFWKVLKALMHQYTHWKTFSYSQRKAMCVFRLDNNIRVVWLYNLVAVGITYIILLRSYTIVIPVKKQGEHAEREAAPLDAALSHVLFCFLQHIVRWLCLVLFCRSEPQWKWVSDCSVVLIPQSYVAYHSSELCFSASPHMDELLIVLQLSDGSTLI